MHDQHLKGGKSVGAEFSAQWCPASIFSKLTALSAALSAAPSFDFPCPLNSSANNPVILPSSCIDQSSMGTGAGFSSATEIP